jgi:hypothetical protein
LRVCVMYGACCVEVLTMLVTDCKAAVQVGGVLLASQTCRMCVCVVSWSMMCRGASDRMQSWFASAWRVSSLACMLHVWVASQSGPCCML